MNVQELIDILSDMNPESEVKLAFQPEWAFQNGIGEVVETQINVEGLTWGVMTTDPDGEEEFEEADHNTNAAAWDRYHSITSEIKRNADHPDCPVVDVRIVALYAGTVLEREEAEAMAMDQPSIVYISDGGQECYLPSSAAEALGWTRS